MFATFRCPHFPAAALIAAALIGCVPASNCFLKTYADSERPITPTVALYVELPDDADDLTTGWYHRLRRLMLERGFNVVNDPANAECLLHFDINPVDSIHIADTLAAVSIKVYDREESVEGALLAERLMEDSLAERVPVIVRTRWSATIQCDAELLVTSADNLAAELLARFGGSVREKFRLERQNYESPLPTHRTNPSTSIAK